eukprot:g39228.t1
MLYLHANLMCTTISRAHVLWLLVRSSGDMMPMYRCLRDSSVDVERRVDRPVLSATSLVIVTVPSSYSSLSSPWKGLDFTDGYLLRKGMDKITNYEPPPPKAPGSSYERMMQGGRKD